MSIIKKPIITEKMTNQSEKYNRFAFVVDRKADISGLPHIRHSVCRWIDRQDRQMDEWIESLMCPHAQKGFPICRLMDG